LRGCVGLGAISILCALALGGCGNGKVIGSGPLPTPSPITPNVSFEYKIPTAASGPADIIAGKDGFLYFTENAASKIGQLSTGGVFKEIATKTPAAGPTGIIVGPNNLIWFTETTAHNIATITSFVSATPVTEYPVPWANAAPAYMANGAIQNTMYFTDPANSAIGQVTTGGTVTGPFATITPAANPLGIALGPDNNMWFCENAAGKIGHLNTATNSVDHEYPVAGTVTSPVDIVQGIDGAMWFTENNPLGPKLGRLTSTGVLNEYPLTGAKSATGLALSLFGNLVVLDPANNSVGQFNPNSLTYTEYPITAANSNPTRITLGPDGKLYFTENAANQIGQFSYF